MFSFNLDSQNVNRVCLSVSNYYFRVSVFYQDFAYELMFL